MTTIIPQISTASSVPASLYTLFLSGPGVFATVLLIILLVLRVLIDAYNQPKFSRYSRTLDVAIVPLVIVLGIEAVLRLLQILKV